jgi:hypothetical protein
LGSATVSVTVSVAAVGVSPTELALPARSPIL